MDAFLPSEIGRLIYGYLFQQCGEGLANEFLNTCDSMRECRLLKQKYAKNFHHKVQDLSLEDILNQYSVLCSLIFKQASTEEPVHRNVLGVLRKVLGSRLLGLSSSSTDRSRVFKSTGDKVDSLVNDKAYVSKTGEPVVQSEHPANPADDTRDSLVGDKIGASVTELEQQANPSDEDNVAFSPAVSDISDNHMDIDNNDSSSADMLEGNSLLNVVNESAPVVASTKCPQKNISPSTENRICAILCNSASLLEHTRTPTGMGNLPFAAEYCTPRKQKDVSLPTVPILPDTHLTKTPISVASTVVNTPLAFVTSIENVSESLSSVAESGLATPKSDEHLNKKSRNEVTKKEKVLQQSTNKTPSKTVTKSSSLTVTMTSTVDSVSPMIPSPAAEVNDHLIVTTPSTEVRKVLPITVPVNLSRVPMQAVSSVYQEPRVSAVPSSMTNMQGVPITTSASAIITEEMTESVFGELSFESECSLVGKFDRSSSSVKSDSEVVSKLRRSPIKRSPRKVNGSPVNSAMSTRSGVTIAPIQNSTNQKAGTTLQTPGKCATDTVILPDSSETASTVSQNEDIPWDLNLRLFVDSSSSMDAHITKRKPKDPRSRKLKEVSKKRKHNDDPDEPLPTTKRIRSEAVAAVPFDEAIPCQTPLDSKSVKVDRSVDLAPSPLRRRRGGGGGKEKVESTLEPVEKKNDRSRRGKGSQEGKIVPDAANRVKVDRRSEKIPKAANTSKSSTLINDIIESDSPAAEKKKSERLERAAAAKKKQQQGTNAKKASSEEIREVPKARSSTKPVAPVDEKAINSTGTVQSRKRSERIERVAALKKSKEDTDSKNSKEPSRPQVKEKPSSSPKETSKSHRKDAKSEARNVVYEEADEILEDHHQSSLVVAVQETKIDNPIFHEEELDFEMVLEISPEFELFHRSPRFEDS